MPSLLDLPREIRDMILELVLSSGRPAPEIDPYAAAAAADSTTRIRLEHPAACLPAPRLDQARRDYLRAPLGVTYEPDSPGPAAVPLLLTNHQLHVETRDALARCLSGPQQQPWTLDLALVREQELWPTWTFVPAHARYVEAIDVTMRIVGAQQQAQESVGTAEAAAADDDEFYQNVWQYPNGVIFGWAVYSALERILKAGPVGPTTHATAEEDEDAPRMDPADCGITVRQLNLHFTTPADTAELADPDTRVDWFALRKQRENESESQAQTTAFRASERANKAMRAKVARPEWAADTLVWFFQHVLLKMEGEWAQYGVVLYERVGNLAIFVDGVLLKDFRLPQRISRVLISAWSPQYRPTPERMRRLARWRNQALEARTRAGFPIITPRATIREVEG